MTLCNTLSIDTLMPCLHKTHEVIALRYVFYFEMTFTSRKCVSCKHSITYFCMFFTVIYSSFTFDQDLSVTTL